MGDVKAFLRSVKVETLLQPKELYLTVKATDTCEAIFRLLVDHSISSVPVVDGGKVVAFATMFDILQAWTNQGDLINTKSYQVAGLAGREPFVKIQKSDTLFSTFKSICIDHPNLHRLAVFDGEEFVGVLSQSQIVKFLYQHVANFDFGTLDLRTRRIGTRQVVCHHPEDLVINAIQTLLHKNISAVGIIDQTGKLVGNFSGSDFRNFGKNKATPPGPSQMKKLTLADFLSARVVTETADGKIEYPITVTENRLVHQVIEKIVKNKLHHVYVVNDHHEPIGIISLVDIIQIFWDHMIIA